MSRLTAATRHGHRSDVFQVGAAAKSTATFPSSRPSDAHATSRAVHEHELYRVVPSFFLSLPPPHPDYPILVWLIGRFLKLEAIDF